MVLEKTITSIFMVPTLKVPKPSLKVNGFINGFIDDSNKEDKYKDSIYLLFRPKDIEKFKTFLDSEYERTNDVILDYDYPNGYVVVIYKLNSKYKEDYELVKKGLYSKTSQKFQDCFDKLIDVPNTENIIVTQESLQYKVFNKTEDLKDFWEKKLNTNLKNVFKSHDYELWQGFNLEKETLDINQLILKL